MNPLLNVFGAWNRSDQSVLFRWEANGSNDRYIHVLGISEGNGTLRIDPKCYMQKDMRFAAGSNMLSISVRLSGGVNGVRGRQFLVFSTDEGGWNENELEAVMNDPSRRSHFVITVIIGHAQLTYSVRNRRVNSARVVSFVLRSSVAIAENVIGYRYMCGDKEICLPFPGAIPGGNKKIKTGEILIPAGSVVQVTPVDQRFNRNFDIRKSSF